MNARTDTYRNALPAYAAGQEAPGSTGMSIAKDSQHPQDEAYEFDVVNEGIEKRLKFTNVCCSQGGCK